MNCLKKIEEEIITTTKKKSSKQKSVLSSNFEECLDENEL